MEIKGKVHCFFEQSGTFKNEFIKLGIPAEDYDIQNNFGETNHVIDLFGEIEKAYGGGNSLFDVITNDDLIMAFFPCIYFESMSMMYFDLSTLNNRNKKLYERIDEAIERLHKRTMFHELLYKMFYVVDKMGLRIILENPATQPNYLVGSQNFIKPSFVDNDRTLRGDYFKKPTAYWFFGCSPTNISTHKPQRAKRTIFGSKCSPSAGVCSEERSMMSPDYARNFICDFIIGKAQKMSQLNLFDDE